MGVEQERNEFVGQMHALAIRLHMQEKRDAQEVEQLMIKNGLDEPTARRIMYDVKIEMEKARKAGGRKDMIYGVLWCIGGTVATATDIGIIFWGAIVFGTFQFLMGALKVMK